MIIDHGKLEFPKTHDAHSMQAVTSGSTMTVAPPIAFRTSVRPTLVVPPLHPCLITKRTMHIREVPPVPSSFKVIRVRWGREEDKPESEKRSQHALAMVSLPLNPEDLRFSMDTNRGGLGIANTCKSPKNRGRPRGSTDKKQLFQGETSDSMAAHATQEPPMLMNMAGSNHLLMKGQIPT